jgi:N-carbamoyl-L-amino-acid hydrolase
MTTAPGGTDTAVMPAANMKVDGDRLWDSLMEMAKIGPGIAGGNNRQALTDEDAEGRRLFQHWCEEAGMAMTVDQMGNMSGPGLYRQPSGYPAHGREI